MNKPPTVVVLFDYFVSRQRHSEIKLTPKKIF